jgi:hypothetical protein
MQPVRARVLGEEGSHVRRAPARAPGVAMRKCGRFDASRIRDFGFGIRQVIELRSEKFIERRVLRLLLDLRDY